MDDRKIITQYVNEKMTGDEFLQLIKSKMTKEEMQIFILNLAKKEKGM